MKARKLAIGLAALSVAAAACTSKAPAGEPSPGVSQEALKIGLVAPFSGPLSSIGRNMREGVALAIEALNAKGGVLGRPVELVERDSEDTASKVNEIVREFVEKERVSLIIGPPSNTAYPAIDQYVRDHKVITMPVITSGILKRNPNPYVFRIMIPDDIQVDLMVRYAVKTRGFSKIAVAATDDPGGKDFLALTKAALASHGTRPTTAIQFSPDDLDLSAVSLTLKQSGAQAIIFGSHIGPYAARLATANANQGYRPQILGFAGLTSYTYADLAREAAVGTVFIAVPIYSTVPRSQWGPRVAEFYDLYTKRYFPTGTESVVGADKVIGAAFLTYDGVQMWAKAAGKAGTADGEKVQAVLNGGFTYGPDESVGGLRWSYSASDHEGIHPGDMWFYRWDKEGSKIRFKFLGPAEDLAR